MPRSASSGSWTHCPPVTGNWICSLNGSMRTMWPARSTIRFAKMSKRYEQEQGENAKKIKALRLELKKDEGKRMDIDEFLETVRRYTDATTITKRMVAELIDHIEVYHAEKQDGVTNQRVVIHYNCIGAFDVPDRRKIPEADIIMETRKGVALSYAPEQVAV